MGGAVGEAWVKAAALHADRVALEVDGATLNYAQLDAASADLATTLTAAACDAPPLPIDATTELDTVVLLLAALRAGLTHGLAPTIVARDEDFTTLRGSKEFQELVKPKP